MMKIETKFEQAAKAVAMTASGVGQRGTFRLGSVLVYKNRVVSVGVNSYKTHPVLATRTQWPFLHAEQHAIIRQGIENCEGLILYVARVLKNNDLALAQPCSVCSSLIEEVGIKQVVYSIDGGDFQGYMVS